MKPAYPISYVEIGRSYAALRFGGASQARARAELGLPEGDARIVEARLQLRRRRPGRDAAHVAAVRAAGGYPALDR